MLEHKYFIDRNMNVHANDLFMNSMCATTCICVHKIHFLGRISRVSDQNGISLQTCIIEICHSG